ncbi:hypothetical protein J2X06_002948 [Lysobacter niastensis]|uniref:Lipoprotein n=1 Tax=Lysobacter niastensis TaxID=380629 RepID=A0ABU1WEF1_9GAMM|nr:hypothetical protein [Lysobacter niastensis]MDR7135730.1 hypothetical protein [Lysobacter niastensis]
MLMRITSFFLLAAFLSGCANKILYTQGAADLPREEAAVLLSDDEQVGISHIDGKHRALGWVSEYRLTPGLHSITFFKSMYLVNAAPITVPYNFEKGHTYKPQSKVDFDRGAWEVRIDDVSATVPTN